MNYRMVISSMMELQPIQLKQPLIT
ncbi:hypothetical protein BDFB_015026 [Asbolus verrucosus]|uniref:Uncharacterized protein n=1 Tax=Asbolus verrucosus TaxID=1661398 RepID=A0A482VC65_ASBVE|nr:hypothetical protein BDFB_015026 [Asbolus verrucosus]